MSDVTPATLTDFQLAIARGCVPDNPCWNDCLEVARDDLSKPGENVEEIASAVEWAATQKWA